MSSETLSTSIDARVKAVYLALGINLAGEKEILGLWIAQNEGAKFWLQVVTELRNRGVQDIFVACVDGLKGFPEAIEGCSRAPACSYASCTWLGTA